MWERTVPVISTRHIKPETLNQIRNQQLTRIAEYEEGAFIYVDSEIEASLIEELPEMEPIICWFFNNYPNEYWICMDRDGDYIKELPIYEW